MDADGVCVWQFFAPLSFYKSVGKTKLNVYLYKIGEKSW